LLQLRDQLDLSFNRFSGPIPSDLGRLVELRTLTKTVRRCGFSLPHSIFLKPFSTHCFVFRWSQATPQSLVGPSSLRTFSTFQTDFDPTRGQPVIRHHSQSRLHHVQHYLSLLFVRLRRVCRQLSLLYRMLYGWTRLRMSLPQHSERIPLLSTTRHRRWDSPKQRVTATSGRTTNKHYAIEPTTQN
jgi:hypothetical protein